ncbi:MAG: Ppx/GppA family phosphatase [Pseudomonadota bacterium]
MLQTVSRLLGLERFLPIPDAATRNAVLDIGSNSVRMVVFDNAGRAPAVYFNEKVLCGLGRDLQRTGALSVEGREMALEAIIRFAKIQRILKLESVEAVGTAAIRDAVDGQDFVGEVATKTGITIKVASGEDEARLAAQGVLLGDPMASGVVADIGGASMELVRIGEGAVGEGISVPVGPLRLAEARKNSPGNKVDRHIDQALKAANGRFAGARRLYLVGGSWRCLFKAHMEHTGYPLRVLHGFQMPCAQAMDVAKWGSQLEIAEIRRLAKASASRAEVTPLACKVLERLLKHIQPDEIVLSAFGLREGILWERLPPARRMQDPLVEACRDIEKASARAAGFGDELWEWLRPLLLGWSPARQREGHAACLLSDACWSAHPDYRSRACFELVTRNNFGGIDHEGRLFIGAVLLSRDRDGRHAMRQEPAISQLLSEQDLGEAEILGRGIRLASTIAAASAGYLPHCRLTSEGGVLVLTMSGEAASLKGEGVQKRLLKLARSVGANSAEIRAEA